MEDENKELSERLEELKRQSLAELEHMESIISESERIKTDISDKAEQDVREYTEIKRTGRFANLVFVVVLAAAGILSIAGIKFFKPMGEYNNAVKLMERGMYDSAGESFKKLGDYRDCADMVKECAYRKAERYMEDGKTGLAISGFGAIRDYKDSSEIINGFIGSGGEIFSAGENHSVALNSIGRVLACGDNTYGQCDVEDWNGITAVAAGNFHTLALCADGSVVAAGADGYGQCDVSDWHDIVSIAAGEYTSYGVRADGSVVAAGINDKGQTDVANEAFTDVAKVVCSGEYAIAVKNNGTLALAGNTEKIAAVSSWSDIKDISAFKHTVCGVKNDGTVVTAGSVNNDTTSQWKDIKTAAAGNCYIIAVDSKGELYSTASTDAIKAPFKNALFIKCAAEHMLALKNDGTVAAVGQNKHNECDTSHWRDIMLR